MTAYDHLRQQLAVEPHTWLITGVAGFIGSHLLETLLSLDQEVIGLDNFSTGSPANLDAVRVSVNAAQWQRFKFHQGSVSDMNACREVSRGAEYVLHQAGFVSVPLSLEDPIACHDTNVTGTLNLLRAARDGGARRVVYASSSAVYGDDPRLPKIETEIGRPLSPYAAAKRMGEIYARLFHDCYGLESVGLRYFNIFGPRQNPTGGYAAVIPHWISALIDGVECVVHGDGTATRDFCPVSDVVQANLLAAAAPKSPEPGTVFNVALGGSTTLKELYRHLVAAVGRVEKHPLHFGPPREGDILHSAADISAIRRALKFVPTANLAPALAQTARWYQTQARRAA